MRTFEKRNYGGFEIDVVDLPPLASVQHMWRDLEARSDISFFTSWSWIGSWLRTLPADVSPVLLRATLNGKVMGLGILVASLNWKARVIPIRVWHLHETGQRDLDNITIEYNGLLVDCTVQHLLEPLMFQYLVDEANQWDELQLNALRRPISQPHGLSTTEDKGSTTVKRTRKLAYQVALREVRDAGQHLSLLKQKPRYHIRRSIKAYEELGPVTVTEAQSVDQALQYLERLKTHHRAYWQLKGEDGAFNHPFFNEFHDELVRTCFARGEIQLLAIKAGDEEIGYLYNFLWNGHVYNYQSGINYQAMGGKHSPGMVAHTLAIDFNAQAGHHTYDLMVGDHQYKRALTLQTVQLDWCTTRRANLPTRMEDTLRTVANRVLSAWTVTSLTTHSLPDWMAATPVAAAMF